MHADYNPLLSLSAATDGKRDNTSKQCMVINVLSSSSKLPATSVKL